MGLCAHCLATSPDPAAENRAPPPTLSWSGHLSAEPQASEPLTCRLWCGGRLVKHISGSILLILSILFFFVLAFVSASRGGTLRAEVPGLWTVSCLIVKGHLRP